jgi:hypothetical protein
MSAQKALRIAAASIVGAALLLASTGSAEAGEKKTRLRFWLQVLIDQKLETIETDPTTARSEMWVPKSI